MLKRLAFGAALAAALPALAADTPAMLPAEAHGAWQAIGRLNRVGYNTRKMCSATLVGPDLVLSAAHCVTGKDGAPVPPDHLIFAAGWLRGTAVAHQRVAEITFFPARTPLAAGSWEEVARDAVLLRLEAPLDGIAPIPMAEPARGTAFRILGYRHDRPHALSDSGDCPPIPAPDALILVGCNVTFGTSGAPLLQEGPAGWRVVASVSGMFNDGAEDIAVAVPVPDAWRD